MTKSTSKTPKKRYFPKDYAPARAAALTSSKKSTQLSAKASLAAKKAATATKNTAKRVAKNLSQSAAKAKSAKRTKSTNYASAKTSRSVHHASAHTKQNRKQTFSWREATLISLIGASAAVILFTFAFTAIFDPVKRSERELEKLANAYYIEYLYPRSLGKYLNQPEIILKDYVDQGLPTVRLRQLLLYNNGKYADAFSAFSNSYYECDTNKTYVRYYPVEPYGPRDYEVKYGTSCEKVGMVD